MMGKEPIRVLQIVGRMDRGGIETMIMNLYRNIDRDKVQFDFLAHYGREAAYNDEIRAMGGRIYEMPALKNESHVYYWRLFQYISALKKFFKEHKEYKIIHGHMTNTASIYMPIAKKNGVTCRIAHSHNTHGKSGMLGYVTNLLQKPIYKNATDWFACSKAAAKWFYPAEDVAAGRVTVVPNAVDAQKFRFNVDTRQKMRQQLGVEDKLVIGCVARFRPEKNHAFLLDVLKEVLKTRENAVLLFAGDGPCEEETKAKAADMGLQEKVIFLGMRSDIPDVMQAMDVFTLASLWEGLPVVGIEAQASGLHCIVSDGVTDEMNAIDMVEYISLQAPISEWADRLIKAAEMSREDTYEKLKEAGYDIHTTAPQLQEFYLKHCGQKD
jgi:glycosyltransferase involved in cell wall biosynthesis